MDAKKLFSVCLKQIRSQYLNVMAHALTSMEFLKVDTNTQVVPGNKSETSLDGLRHEAFLSAEMYYGVQSTICKCTGCMRKDWNTNYSILFGNMLFGTTPLGWGKIVLVPKFSWPPLLDIKQPYLSQPSQAIVFDSALTANLKWLYILPLEEQCRFICSQLLFLQRDLKRTALAIQPNTFFNIIRKNL